ncbi:hypothetical protein [Gemmobacter caeruleus]|uniref:hypothetical protein n=1 Tax=Gemmobacter caeruleus TaxID=2595004 RepID=UPI0011EC68BC|nr:hypothetical protein [Gemmobacter caeruleus]
MIYEFLAAIIAAIGCAGLVLLARKLVPGLPKWAMPFGAAVGLIGTTVWLEYDWFDRVSAELPEGIEVVWRDETPQGLRPWSFVAPLTTRFLALDTRKVTPHPAQPDLRLAHVYNFARWRPVEDGFLAVDCAGQRRVAIVEGVEITPEGVLQGAEWQAAAADDPVMKAACREG